MEMWHLRQVGLKDTVTSDFMMSEYAAFFKYPSLPENHAKQGKQETEIQSVFSKPMRQLNPDANKYEDGKRAEISDNIKQEGKCNHSVLLSSAVNNIYS